MTQFGPEAVVELDRLDFRLADSRPALVRSDGRSSS